MGYARRWACVALAGLVAACLFGMTPSPARAEQELLDWRIDGGAEVGFFQPWGNRSSSEWNKYRDMTSGVPGEVNIFGEHKTKPWFFEFNTQSPGRTDQRYEGGFGYYGLFKLDGGWSQIPVTISNTGTTIFTQNGDNFSINPALRNTLVANYNAVNAASANNGYIFPLRANMNTAIANLQNTLNALEQPAPLHYMTNFGDANAKFTPTENLRFDFGWENIHRQGSRPLGTVIGSPGGAVQELNIPIDNSTNEYKFGAQFANQTYGVQFNYLGSYFSNQLNGYTWQNPVTTINDTANTAQDRVSAPPDNSSNTFALTGTSALPFWRSRINGTLAYTMLRQDDTFNYSTQNPALNRTNTNAEGRSSLDGQVNLYNANFVLTSRPVDELTLTARYRYFDYRNNTPTSGFVGNVYAEGIGPAETAYTYPLRYHTQGFGFDAGYRPNNWLTLNGGYAYNTTSRGNYEGSISDPDDPGQSFSTTDQAFKTTLDIFPSEWFNARFGYTYSWRTITGYQQPDPSTVTDTLPNATPYMFAPYTGNNLNGMLQFPIWETVTPSIYASYQNANVNNNQYGLLSTDYWDVGVNVDWNPVKWLTLGADFAYETYNSWQAGRYWSPPPPALYYVPANDWKTKSTDNFYTIGLNATFDIVPKKFIVTAGYSASIGYTYTNNFNPNFGPTPAGLTSAQTTNPTQPGFCATCTNQSGFAYGWDTVRNVFQTAKVVAKYFITEKLSVRGGFAWQGYSEHNFSLDPMQQFMGLTEITPTNFNKTTGLTQGFFGSTTGAGNIQSNWLGATVPGYNAYIVSGFVRYDF